MTIHVPSMKNKYNSLSAGKTRGQKQCIMWGAPRSMETFAYLYQTAKRHFPQHGNLNYMLTFYQWTDVNSHLNNATISKWVIISTYLRIYSIQTKTNYIKLSVIELSVILTINRTGFSQTQITSNMFSKNVTFMTHEGSLYAVTERAKFDRHLFYGGLWFPQRLRSYRLILSLRIRRRAFPFLRCMECRTPPPEEEATTS